MTENNTAMQPASGEEELVLVLDGIYSELAQDINAAKTAILNEVKYTAVQSQSVENDLSAKLCEQVAAIKALANELKYSLQQSQAVHTDISETIHEEVSTKLEAVDANTTLLEEIDKAVQELMEKISALDLDGVADKVLAEIPVSSKANDNTRSQSKSSARLLKSRICPFPSKRKKERTFFTSVSKKDGGRVAINSSPLRSIESCNLPCR